MAYARVLGKKGRKGEKGLNAASKILKSRITKLMHNQPDALMLIRLSSVRQIKGVSGKNL